MTKETEKLKQEITGLDIDTSNLIKIVDKLEQRISKLEKVLQSHAKCIGELRGTELRIHDLKDNNE
jgi:predicted ATP-grasp superfamily ATP-dependent carboligase|tara:strand:+ start:445 stop:642 length:198 start_codon:yes stop_codon:yes gene_type:complete